MNGGFWCVVGEERLVRSWRCDWKRGGGAFICNKGREGGRKCIRLLVCSCFCLAPGAENNWNRGDLLTDVAETWEMDFNR